MRTFTFIVMSALLLSALLLKVNAEPIVLVVGKDVPVSQLTKSEVIDLFMGKYSAYPSGEKAIIVELAHSSAIQKQFYQQLTGRTLSSINAYWARLKFSGHKREVIIKESQQTLIEFVKTNPYAIGYVYAKNVDENLKVVYSLDE